MSAWFAFGGAVAGVWLGTALLWVRLRRFARRNAIAIFDQLLVQLSSMLEGRTACVKEMHLPATELVSELRRLLRAFGG